MDGEGPTKSLHWGCSLRVTLKAYSTGCGSCINDKWQSHEVYLGDFGKQSKGFMYYVLCIKCLGLIIFLDKTVGKTKFKNTQ